MAAESIFAAVILESKFFRIDNLGVFMFRMSAIHEAQGRTLSSFD
jgi:hypothetical protein